MLKKQLYKALLITFALITIIYGFILIPFEKQRLHNVEQKVEVLLNAVMEQRSSDIGNLLFMNNKEGLGLVAHRIKELDAIIDVDIYDTQGNFLSSSHSQSVKKELLKAKALPDDYHFEVVSLNDEQTGIFTKSISVLG